MRNEMDLKGRVALITGSTQGIGRAIALAFAREGAELVICSRTGQMDEEFTDTVRSLTTYSAHRVNARKNSQIHELIGTFRKLDILVNNVGGPIVTGNFFELTENDWLDTIDLNLMSAVRFTKAAIPLLRESPYPRIINISSFVAHQPGKFNPHYGAAKAGLEYLNKYLSLELARDGILVNAIAPDTMLGGGWSDNVRKKAHLEQLSYEDAEKVFKAECSAKVPLGRIGRLDDVANLAVFLASDKATHITGSVITVDGGRRATVR